MTFKSDEREQQLRWKNTTTTLSSEARAAGLYTRPPPEPGRALKREEMFLHESRTGENLSPTVRAEALAIFRNAGIPWHDASGDGGPSNFLMDSMVSCVNCLLPFAHEGKALAKLLHTLVPDAV